MSTLDGRLKRSGRGWAYFGVVLGGAVSVAANVAATFIPPEGAAAGWVPPAGGVVSAVCWPVLLLVAVELFARIGWPAGWRWWLLRAAGLVPVGLIAAIVSYRHLSRLLAWYGEDALTAALGPLAVDGLMVMATGALLAGGGSQHSSAPAAVTDRDTSPRPQGAPVLPRTAPEPNPRRTAARSRQRSHAELIDAVKRVEKNPDGTVPVRRAAKALGTGPDRARRLLREAGLLRQPVRVPDRPVRASIDTQNSDVR